MARGASTIPDACRGTTAARIRPLVRNTEDRAALAVSLVSTRGMPPLSEALPVVGPVGLCASPVVNEGVVAPPPPEKAAPPNFVVGTIWMTGDTVGRQTV